MGEDGECEWEREKAPRENIRVVHRKNGKCDMWGKTGSVSGRETKPLVKTFGWYIGRMGSVTCGGRGGVWVRAKRGFFFELNLRHMAKVGVRHLGRDRKNRFFLEKKQNLAHLLELERRLIDLVR